MKKYERQLLIKRRDNQLPILAGPWPFSRKGWRRESNAAPPWPRAGAVRTEGQGGSRLQNHSKKAKRQTSILTLEGRDIYATPKKNHQCKKVHFTLPGEGKRQMGSGVKNHRQLQSIHRRSAGNSCLSVKTVPRPKEKSDNGV